MSLLSLCRWLYAWLLRLYPSAFRDEFAAEMRDTFTNLLHDDLERGGSGLLLTCLRELRDVPLAALRLRLSSARHSRQKRPRALNAAASSVAFAMAGVAPALAQHALRRVPAHALRCVRIPPMFGHAWDCHALPFMLAPGPLLYYAVCGCCGAGIGLLLSLSLRQRSTRAGLALAGCASFGLGALVSELWLPPCFGTGLLGAIGSLAIEVVFMGILMSLYLAVMSRDWLLFFRLSARGPAALVGGSVLGFLVTMLVWGLVQAGASNQGGSLFTWAITNSTAVLPGVLRAVASVTWGLVVARVLARRAGAGPAPAI